MIMLQFKHYLN